MEQQSPLFKFNIETRDLKRVLHDYQKINLFTDCTIAAACGRALDVHKVVLSSCSTYLAKLFLRRSADLHPILVFGNLKFEDLSKVIEFIYKGEVTVEEDHLDGFMAAAEILQVELLDFGVLVPANELVKRSEPAPQAPSLVNDGNESDTSSEMEEETPEEVKAKKVTQPKFLRRSSVASASRPSSIALNKRRNTINEPPSSACVFCDKIIVNPKNRTRHQRECLKNPNRVTFTCKFCSKSFTRKLAMKAHEKSHDKENVKDFDHVSQLKNTSVSPTKLRSSNQS